MITSQMKILFLGDVVGPSGCKSIQDHLPGIIKENNIDFVIVNGENADDSGVGITEKITENFFKAGADVITTGNHVWDQKETMEHISRENRLLRPENLIENSPGNGINIFNTRSKIKVAAVKYKSFSAKVTIPSAIALIGVPRSPAKSIP